MPRRRSSSWSWRRRRHRLRESPRVATRRGWFDALLPNVPSKSAPTRHNSTARERLTRRGQFQHRIEKRFQFRSDFVVTDAWPAVICCENPGLVFLAIPLPFGHFRSQWITTDNGFKGLSRRRPRFNLVHRNWIFFTEGGPLPCGGSSIRIEVLGGLAWVLAKHRRRVGRSCGAAAVTVWRGRTPASRDLLTTRRQIGEISPVPETT